MRHRHLAALATLTSTAVLLLIVRRRYLRWGATDQEISESLPGDDLLSSANLIATRTVSIDTSSEHVWPWIAQLGQGRGGLYSYDLLENLVGCDMHSADHILPQYQAVEVGDDFRLHPQVTLKVLCWIRGTHSLFRAGCRWERQLRRTTSHGHSF